MVRHEAGWTMPVSVFDKELIPLELVAAWALLAMPKPATTTRAHSEPMRRRRVDELSMVRIRPWFVRVAYLSIARMSKKLKKPHVNIL